MNKPMNDLDQDDQLCDDWSDNISDSTRPKRLREKPVHHTSIVLIALCLSAGTIGAIIPYIFG